MTESDLELYGIVGKMFREIRESNGHTLEYVSNFLGIAPKSLQRYECGERKMINDCKKLLIAIIICQKKEETFCQNKQDFI